MRAMRLASEFFASLPNGKLNERRAAFDLTTTTSVWSWFYLKGKQLLLFFQDPIHLATKWRNRLLSSTAQLRIGRQYITIEHLIDIVEDSNYSKLDHGLSRSGLNPKDRQNFHSCIKIAADDVLSILAVDVDTHGTFVYLYLLKKVYNRRGALCLSAVCGGAGFNLKDFSQQHRQHQKPIPTLNFS